MRSRFTSLCSISATASTALTHISANMRLHRPTLSPSPFPTHTQRAGVENGTRTTGVVLVRHLS
jgi:hypothetical protein